MPEVMYTRAFVMYEFNKTPIALFVCRRVGIKHPPLSKHLPPHFAQISVQGRKMAHICSTIADTAICCTDLADKFVL